MTCRALFLVFALVAAPSLALRATEHRGTAAAEAAANANPIRKVVNMLQSMQKKVEEEGAKNKDLYDKFMCYCKNSGASLSAGITAAEAQKVQPEADLKKAQTDRSE